ncbi:Hypothetical predicted protein [Lecanosticta acicola]|uniref:Uncharacterized protein n=1 Tax=Lecanosticta acicola TaxID=111012 RepID=A0AAI8Z1M5_9PEZI|nr:Hypothetical predicted protein [Lecanosticta acicola]
MQSQDIAVSNAPIEPVGEDSSVSLNGFDIPRRRISLRRLMPLGPRYWGFMSRTRNVKPDYRIKKSRSRPPQVMNEEQRIAVCKTSLDQVYTMLRTSPQHWRDYVNLARTIISHLESITFMQQENRTQEQVWMIAGLQRLAFADAESGAVNDIAAWCSRQWLVILQRDAQNLAALRGIGQAWLSRAQRTLARIHQADGASSSSGGSALSQRSFSSVLEEDVANIATAEAEIRAGTAVCVEARGYLQPATDYLERAVAAATEQRAVSGDLLSVTAEAYMSLGSASSPRINGQCFSRALQLLQAAKGIAGYNLSPSLRQYLEDYGKLLE